MYKISIMQALLSDPKPIEALSLKEYGCSNVYRLAITSPTVQYLIIKDTKEGEQFDFESSHYVFEYRLPMQLRGVEDGTIKATMIEELAWKGFIQVPEIEFVAVKYKDNLEFDGKTIVAYITKDFWEDIQKFQNCFKEVDTQAIVQAYMMNQMTEGKNDNYAEYEKAWLELDDIERAKFVQETYKEDIETWNALKEKRDIFHNTVCEFVGWAKKGTRPQGAAWRLSTLLGVERIVEALPFD